MSSKVLSAHLLLLVLAPFATAQTETVIIRPKEIEDVLVNPG